jgi:hypothetical protein
MLSNSPAQRLQPRPRPAGGRRRDTRRLDRGGDTDALDWRSDPHLRAILARVGQRLRQARGKGQIPDVSGRP